MTSKRLLLLLILTLGSLLVHGYHPWAEDAEIYLPGVEKLLQANLFPFGAEFFQSHASLTLFPNLLAALVRITHLPLEPLLFLVHLASIFLLLLACWELSGHCFVALRARWAGVALIASLLTLPVAGTALYIMDQYVNPRNLTAFALIFSIAKVLDRKYLQAAPFLIFAAAIHPFMSVFALFFCCLLIGMERFSLRFGSFASILPFGAIFELPSKAYHQVALSHPNHYLLRWQWYEWLGIVAPLGVLWWFGRVAASKQQKKLELLCFTLIPYQIISTLAALTLSIPARLESMARIQPLRSLDLLYILLFVTGGGFFGEYVLRNHVWRWLVLFLPLCGGMFAAQRALFPASAHVEWPGAPPENPWAQAFVWIRQNTAPHAIFALDPFHMQIPGEDANGFRAIAQRSMLADAVKDSGAVSMFPPMAEEWQKEVVAQRGWRSFQSTDLGKLWIKYNVSWVVLQRPGIGGLYCPYQNKAVLVCPNPALEMAFVRSEWQ